MSTLARGRFRVLAMAVFAVAVAFAVFGGVRWWTASADVDSDQAAMRDEALRSATAAVETFNTLDHRNVDEGLDRWLSAATGPLADELRATRDASRERIVKAGTATQGKVVDAAVTELDPADGTAAVIASVEVVVTPETGDAVTKRVRFTAQMTKTDRGWLLSGIAQVPTSPV
ncbi:MULTISPECIES: hypothetical protein [Actinokineospora]|uniref:Mce-associated membrane protein n=1 Tax=Actinokineospora fastidiosa TaxID=1816 RepID=A0A918GN03_9PSEU|nr:MULTISPECIES: hypothetical protein [Actinokineospora]UVS78919.1 hypothetical protein Actkin_02656 [Actinokineospora sp. UTMC 2448]GGS48180.1 hypothetical protein GCM10010171_49270 [Actinokineospora fastidiosa]